MQYPYPTPVWPDFNSTNDGLNMFSTNGNTPTGLIEFDLNSPEDEPKLYGPYPVNRAVQGLKVDVVSVRCSCCGVALTLCVLCGALFAQGNAAFLLPQVRNGILMHTGEWPGWNPPQPMPNSEGKVAGAAPSCSMPNCPWG